jgi:tRNA(fMet)-specific endonuclease VapC
MDKELICLDTSILIDYFRKKNKEKTKFVSLSKKYKFAISVITKLEILTGINSYQSEFWKSIFEKIEIIPLKENEVEIAAQIIKDLRQKNKIIGLKDILIALSAISKRIKISTLNLKDFKRIDDLKIIDEDLK